LEAYLRLIGTKTIRAKWYAKMNAPSRVETGPACRRYAMSVPVVRGFSNASRKDEEENLLKTISYARVKLFR